MSQYDRKSVALKYDENQSAPIVVASGMGFMAEKIVEIANQNEIPVYEDSSLATVLTQLQLGAEIPEEVYQAVVEIYVFFLNYGKNMPKEVAEARDAKTARQQTAEAMTAGTASNRSGTARSDQAGTTRVNSAGSGATIAEDGSERLTAEERRARREARRAERDKE